MAPSFRTRASDDVTNNLVGHTHNQSPITLEGSNFLANGHVILSQVPDNITATPSPYTSIDKSITTVGCFVGFNATESTNRHVVSIGKLRDIKFMSIFRVKDWWTTHWVGSNGRDIENETQMVILQNSDLGRPYVLLLPLLEGSFRASFQPGQNDNVDLCVESGSSKGSGDSFRTIIYTHAGEDPFSLVKEAMKVVKVHLGTLKLLEGKNPPGIVDKFGWCTWDAFYLTVHPQGVLEGGCPPGLVLLDDGWQSIGHDSDPMTQEGMNQTVAGEQMPCRLLKFQENYGGRVELAKAYHKACASVRKHFNGNGVIASMEHCNDFMFLGTEAICLGRVGDDFWCTDPSGDPNGTFWLQGCITKKSKLEPSLSFKAKPENSTTDEIISSFASERREREPIFYNFIPIPEVDQYQCSKEYVFATKTHDESEEVSTELKLGYGTCIPQKRKTTENLVNLSLSSTALGNDPWVIKKRIKKSDIGHLSKLLLWANWVKKHILPLWNAERIEKIKDGVVVGVWDYDTKSEHQLLFKQWPSNGSYVLIGKWNVEFVKRRDLKIDDEIGLYWDKSNSSFNFSLLKRASSNRSSL